MRMIFKASVAAGTIPLVLAGCTTYEPPALAVTQFSAIDCVSTPDLASAITLVPEKDKQVWIVDHAIDSVSPCLQWADSNGPYALFSLPPDWGAPIEIGAVLEGARLFSPHVVLLDGQGNELRNFEPEQYNVRSHYSGRLYSVQFQPRTDERYVLVTSNPARVGQVYDSITTGTASTYIATGFGGSNWVTGVESSIARGFSFEGLVRAQVYRPEDEDR